MQRILRRHGQVWLAGAGALLAVWVIAWAGMAWASSQQVTAEKVTQFVQDHPLRPEMDAKARRAVVEGLAWRMNRLEYSQRRQVHVDRTIEPVLRAMNDDERMHFVDATLPQGIKQMMEAFNKMSREKRQQIVEEALLELRKQSRRQREGKPEKWESEEVQRKVVEEGLKVYFRDASATTKLDLQPLIEQIQRDLQMPKGHR